MAKKEKRFVTVYNDETFATAKQVIVDRLTGVNYLFVHEGYAGGLAPLLDAQGRPIVTPINHTEE